MATTTQPMTGYIEQSASKKQGILGMVIGMVLGVMLFVVLHSTNVIDMNSIVNGSQTEQVTLSEDYAPAPLIPSVQDKMVSYMRMVNPSLDEGVAYRLANGILEQNKKYNLPIDLQLGLIKVESHFKQYELSPVGAVGFYQILPKWHIDKIERLYKTGVVETKNLYTAKMQSELGGEILYTCLRKHRHNTTKALLCYNGSQHDKEKTYAKLVLEAKKEAGNFI